MKYAILIIFLSQSLFAQYEYFHMETDDLSFFVRSDGLLFPEEKGGVIFKETGDTLLKNVGMIFLGQDPNGNYYGAHHPIAGVQQIGKPFELGVIDPETGLPDYIIEPSIVTKDEILAHIQDYDEDCIIDEERYSIYSWPGKDNPFFEDLTGNEMPSWRISAPFFDRNNNEIYEPDLGDFPTYKNIRFGYDIPEKIIFLNFRTKYDQGSPSEYFPLQFKLIVYVKSCDKISELHSNRSIHVDCIFANFNHSDLRQSLFGYNYDFHLGDTKNDYIGFKEKNNLVYTYNNPQLELASEEGISNMIVTHQFIGTPLGPFNYGNEGTLVEPPFGSTSFDTILETGMSRFRNYYLNADSVTWYPESVPQWHDNLINSTWKDGTPFTIGGNGYNIGSTDTTDIAFNGEFDGSEGWTELNANNTSGKRFASCFAQQIFLKPGAVNQFKSVFQFLDHNEGLPDDYALGLNVAAGRGYDDFISSNCYSQAQICNEFGSQPEGLFDIFYAYPNPNTTGVFQLVVDENKLIQELRVMDFTGTIILQEENVYSNQFTLEEKGLYVVVLKIEDRYYSQQIFYHD